MTISELDNIANRKIEPVKIKKDPSKPLTGMKFMTAGKLSRTNAEIKSIIENLGGKLSTKIENSVIALITNKAEYDKMSKKISDMKAGDIYVINEDIADDLEDDNIIKMISNEDEFINLINKHKLSIWGSDLKERIKNSDPDLNKTLKKTNSEKFQSKSTGTVKMKVKGGAAVDPDCGLDSLAHILREKDGTNDPYSVVLSLVDIVRGTNSYYKLQLLEHDNLSRWYIFRSWGRVGTTIGGNKLDQFSNRDDAIEDFHVVYFDKTGNNWEDRKDFQKKPNKFFPIDVDYGETGENDNFAKLDSNRENKSKLDKPIQDLIHLIFDIEKMKNAMIEFEIDLNKMPLGKLSSNQLKKAFGVLNELTDVNNLFVFSFILFSESFYFLDN
jgi:poly [ADP-ribose] polymerase 1